MSFKLQIDVIDLLENAVKDKIENFEVTIQNEKKTGDGFLGEMTFVSLKNKITGEDHHLVIKKVLPGKTEGTVELMSKFYKNEIKFYTEIWPALQDFQKSYPEAKKIDCVPKSYVTSSEMGSEKIVLENLKMDNYELHPKQIPLNFILYEEIFKVYGKYHGLNFAFKQQNQEKFLELGADLNHNWINMIESGTLKGFNMVFEICEEILNVKGDKKNLEKIQKFMDEGDNVFINAVQYKGPNSIFVHGDCWSNNLLLKFNQSKELKDIKLIDFQLCDFGTPIFDLTYSLYSGATKETLDKLEILLQTYHKALSKTLSDYGYDSEKIYSFETLKIEWKHWNTFGFIMGCLVWIGKFSENLESIKLNDHMDSGNKGEESEFMKELKFDKKVVHERIKDLILHMCENDFL